MDCHTIHGSPHLYWLLPCVCHFYTCFRFHYLHALTSCTVCVIMCVASQGWSVFMCSIFLIFKNTYTQKRKKNVWHVIIFVLHVMWLYLLRVMLLFGCRKPVYVYFCICFTFISAKYAACPWLALLCGEKQEQIPFSLSLEITDMYTTTQILLETRERISNRVSENCEIKIVLCHGIMV